MNRNPATKDIDLRDLARILAGHWLLIAVLSFFGGIAPILYQKFRVEPIYTSNCSIMPFTESPASSSLLEKLQSAGQFLGIKEKATSNPLEVIFKSRSFFETLAIRFGIPEKKKISVHRAGESIRSRFDIKTGPPHLLTWKSEKPEECVTFLRAVLEETEKLYREKLSLNQQAQRIFLEERILEINKRLEAEEEKLLALRREHHGIDPTTWSVYLSKQMQDLVERRSRLETDHRFSQEWLATESRDVISQEKLLRLLDLQIDGLLKEGSRYADLQLLPLQSYPEKVREYEGLQRRIQELGKIKNVLHEQHELKKLEAAQKIQAFEVIDPPYLPEHPSNLTSIKLLFLLGAMGTGILAAALIVLRSLFLLPGVRPAPLP